MSSLAIITPSYAPDFELCRDLHRSIVRFAPDSVTHQIIVPSADLDLFGELASARCTITAARDILPRTMLRVPRANLWVNIRRPYPPVRGWIAQQLIKIIAAARTTDDVALLVDSDVEFIRPFDAGTYLEDDGSVAFFRRPDEVDAGLPRHLIWHNVSRQLLGIEGEAKVPAPDYICWPMAWDPAIVRQMLARVEESTGKPWINAIGSRLHFSEGILYGVFVDEVLKSAVGSASMRCLQHTGPPLDLEQLQEFLRGTRDDDVCVMVSAKSDTPLDARRKAIADFVATL